MANPSPLSAVYHETDAIFLPYGDQVELVAEHQTHEIEYAAIRKSVGMMDCPHRGLVRLTGGERLDFLHRMTSNDCKSLTPGDVRRLFLLNVKGRIMADVVAANGEDYTLLDTDIYTAESLTTEIDNMLFGEDVQIDNLTETYHRVSFHGPNAPNVLPWWEAQSHSDDPSYLFHHEETGNPGIHIWLPKDEVGKYFSNLESFPEDWKLKPLGWMGYNIARLEMGYPLFNVDFGTDSLPHETGAWLMKQAVSFTKGCYRGQEIVARMDSRGHPAKIITGFKTEGDELPVAGSPIYDDKGEDAKVVGAVTSSAHAPLMSQTGIGLGMIKWDFHEPGTTLYAATKAGRQVIKTCEVPFIEL